LRKTNRCTHKHKDTKQSISIVQKTADYSNERPKLESVILEENEEDSSCSKSHLETKLDESTEIPYLPDCPWTELRDKIKVARVLV
jgi:hypothetical protein